MADRPIALRNVARYVQDVDENVPLYEALGFQLVRRMGDLAILRHDDGMGLVLHAWDGHKAQELDTAIGLTMTGDTRAARDHVEQAGWICLREPEEGDEGFFFIYGDRDGNPINLVGTPKK